MCSGLEKYIVEVVDRHPERDRHPLPVVLLFSDGHNGGSCPLGVADQIRSLNIDGDTVTIAAASVHVEGSMPPDGNLLRQIASPGCYVNVDKAELLTEFLARIGSSTAMSSQELAGIAAPLDRPARLESQATAPPALPGPRRRNRGRGRGRRSGGGGGTLSDGMIRHGGGVPVAGFFGKGD